jgi:hypothetical protein
MYSHSAHETPTRTEEQVGVTIWKATKGVEGVAVHCNRDARGERWIFIKDVPVGVMKRRHDNALSKLIPPPFIRPAQSKKNHYSNLRTIKRWMELKKWMWDQWRWWEKGRNAQGSAPTICQLSFHFITPFRMTFIPTSWEDLPKRTLTNLAECDPSKFDQSKEEQSPHFKGCIAVNVRPLHCLCSQYVYAFILLFVTISTRNSGAFHVTPLTFRNHP